MAGKECVGTILSFISILIKIFSFQIKQLAIVMYIFTVNKDRGYMYIREKYV